jgi:hypothetical protein
VLEDEAEDGKAEMVLSKEAGSTLDNTAQSPILKVIPHPDHKKRKIRTPLVRCRSGNAI